MKMAKAETEQYERESPMAAAAAELADAILGETTWSRDNLRDCIVGFLIRQELHGNLTNIGAEIRKLRAQDSKPAEQATSEMKAQVIGNTITKIRPVTDAERVANGHGVDADAMAIELDNGVTLLTEGEIGIGAGSFFELFR